MMVVGGCGGDDDDCRHSLMSEGESDWSESCPHRDIDDCASAPCLNGAVCADAFANFVCTCQAGYAGFRCDAGGYEGKIYRNNVAAGTILTTMSDDDDGDCDGNHYDGCVVDGMVTMMMMMIMTMMVMMMTMTTTMAMIMVIILIIITSPWPL